ncbi:MAG: hypothetical protein R3C20_04710 [Planctomycetaceae bacterium]
MTDHQFQFASQIVLDRTGHADGGFSRFGKHEEVVGIADEMQTTMLQFPVEVIQQDVRQDRRQRTALHRAFDRGMQFAFDQHARSQPPLAVCQALTLQNQTTCNSVDSLI